MFDGSDPYRPPDSPFEPHEPALRPDAGLALLARWERLRIVYNLILAAVVVLVGLAFGRTLHPAALFARCLGANLCFCAGPVLNAYAHWLGLRHPAVTWVLFSVGTLFAILLAALSAMPVLLPGMD